MSNMKCPICGKDLVEIELGECWFLVCCNSKCRCKGVASDTVWEFLTIAIKNRKALSQELIRTGKALDKAKWWLNEIVESHRCTPISTAEMALKEITALEQKD